MSKLLRETVWEGKGCGLEGGATAATADSLHSPHPVGQTRVLSIHILIAISPFGDLSVRKGIQAFFSLLFYSFFFGGSNRRTISLCCHSALQPAWIQLPVRPHGKLLNHHFKSESIGTLKARAPQVRSHFCMPVPLSPTFLWSLDRRSVFMPSAHSTQGWLCHCQLCHYHPFAQM